MRKLLSIVLLLSLVLNACSSDKNNTEEPQPETEVQTTENPDSIQLIEMTPEQVKSVNIEYGNFQDLQSPDMVNTSGTINVPPNSIYQLSAKADGILHSKIKLVEGDYLKSGTVIGYIENPDFISKQEEYLQTKAALSYSQKEYNRQKTLIDSNAGIQKNVDKYLSEVQGLQAKLAASQKYLNYLGISTSGLTSANISDHINLVLGSSGYISNINIHNGMYVRSSDALMDVTNTGHLHLELNVYENDIAKVAVGQQILYIVPALGTQQYEGRVSVIGKSFDPQNKTVRVHGHMENSSPQFINDLFVKAQIVTGGSTSMSLPEDAIVDDGEHSYIYFTPSEPDQEDRISFYQYPVEAGPVQNGNRSISLLYPIPNGMVLVTSGAYYIYASARSESLEHD